MHFLFYISFMIKNFVYFIIFYLLLFSELCIKQIQFSIDIKLQTYILLILTNKLWLITIPALQFAYLLFIITYNYSYNIILIHTK